MRTDSPNLNPRGKSRFDNVQTHERPATSQSKVGGLAGPLLRRDMSASPLSSTYSIPLRTPTPTSHRYGTKLLPHELQLANKPRIYKEDTTATLTAKFILIEVLAAFEFLSVLCHNDCRPTTLAGRGRG